MCKITDKFTKNPEIMWRQLGSQIVTLHIKNHQYHVLNESAALVFELSTGNNTVEAVGQELAKRFNLDKKQALEDARETFDGMAQLGLLLRAEDPKSGYARPAVRAVTEEHFKDAIAGSAKLVCRSLLGA